MEKLLLTSKNFSRAKKHAKGTLDLFEALEKQADFDNVRIEAPLPEEKLYLHWEEFSTPLYQKNGFDALVSPKLYSYKFQYLGGFCYGEQELQYGGEENPDAETFSSLLQGRSVFRSISPKSEQCNCTWLIDFLLHSDQIASDPLRPEQLYWIESAAGFQLIIEQTQNARKISEKQIFSFQNQFQSVSWEHVISLH